MSENGKRDPMAALRRLQQQGHDVVCTPVAPEARDTHMIGIDPDSPIDSLRDGHRITYAGKLVGRLLLASGIAQKDIVQVLADPETHADLAAEGIITIGDLQRVTLELEAEKNTV